MYVPMRYGKTWLAINAAAALHLKHFAPRVLIVCPNDVKEVWEEEIEKHCPIAYKLLDRPVHDRFSKEQQGWPYKPLLYFHIRNYEAIWARIKDELVADENSRAWSAVSDKALLAWRPDIVIVDEAHHIGKPSTLTSKKVYQIGRVANFRIFMTGTPFHRKPFYVFGQFKFYNPGVFGDNFTQFKKHIAVFGGFGNYEVKKYRNLKWLTKKIKPHVFVAKKVPTTPPVYKHFRFDLDKSLKLYKQMAKESIIHVGEDEITAEIVLTRYLRLAQIAGGWVKTENGKYKRVGNEKKRALQKRIVEYRENELDKIVVGCRFIPELVDVRTAFLAAGYSVYLVHGGVDRRDRTIRRDAFNNDDGRAVFVTQFRPSREGIDLSSADAMLYYSLPEDYLTYDQFAHRIEKYNEKRTLLYEHLLARNTVEMLAYEAISRQEDIATYILSDPKRVERLTSRL